MTAQAFVARRDSLHIIQRKLGCIALGFGGACGARNGGG